VFLIATGIMKIGFSKMQVVAPSVADEESELCKLSTTPSIAIIES
jgi:hypothetical protein